MISSSKSVSPAPRCRVPDSLWAPDKEGRAEGGGESAAAPCFGLDDVASTVLNDGSASCLERALLEIRTALLNSASFGHDAIGIRPAA